MTLNLFPKHSQKLLVHLLIHGEVNRTKAKEVLGVSAPTSIPIIKELLARDYLQINKVNSKIRFKLNTVLSGFLIPDLFNL